MDNEVMSWASVSLSVNPSSNTSLRSSPTCIPTKVIEINVVVVPTLFFVPISSRLR